MKNCLTIAMYLGVWSLSAGLAHGAIFKCPGECVKNGKAMKEVHCTVEADDPIEALLKAEKECRSQCRGGFGDLVIEACE